MFYKQFNKFRVAMITCIVKWIELFALFRSCIDPVLDEFLSLKINKMKTLRSKINFRSWSNIESDNFFLSKEFFIFFSNKLDEEFC